jgi:hypothetical protein
MKASHMIYRDGKHVANQIAGTRQRAIELASVKLKTSKNMLVAVEECSSDSARLTAAWDSFFLGDWIPA